jgi:hypothetical protein
MRIGSWRHGSPERDAYVPIRVRATSAERWGVSAAGLYHAHALARQEFRTALLAVVAFHHAGIPAEVEQEAASLLKALG